MERFLLKKGVFGGKILPLMVYLLKVIRVRLAMTEYLLYNIVLGVIAITGIAYLISSKQQFNKFLLAILFVFVIHSVSIYAEMGLPLALLYGPLVYLLNLFLQRGYVKLKFFFLHFSPFLAFTLVYAFTLYRGESPLTSWGAYLNTYYPLYFVAMFLSLLIYPFAVFRKGAMVKDTRKAMLITQLSTGCILIAGFVLFVAINTFTPVSIGVDLHWMVYALLFSCIMLILLYIAYNYQTNFLIGSIETSKSEERVETVSQIIWPRYQNSSLSEDLLEQYANRVYSLFAESEIYLQSGISLDVLSKETNIPRHHFSQLFNVYIGKSFYHLIAEYRIKYALQRITEEDNITVEALAHECGFSSKTSFNKYFKELTGYSPSEYRALNSEKQASIC